MHILTAPRRKVVAVGNERMADDRVSTLKSRNAFANFLDPASVLVPHNIGQFHVNFLAPNPLDHVEIGATDTGTANPDDHIGTGLNFRLGDLFQSDKLRVVKGRIILMQYSSFHSVITKTVKVECLRRGNGEVIV